MTPTILDAALLMMSPTKSGKVRVSSTRYRNDPYRARVNPFLKPGSPIFVPKLRTVTVAAPAAIRPAADESVESIPATFTVAAMKTPEMKPAPVAPAAAASFVAAAEKPLPAAASAPLAAAASEAPSKPTGPVRHFALIGFKHETAMFQAPFRVAVGDVVIVEADRGEHIGVIQSLSTVPPKYNVPCRILRHANATEVELIDELTLKEKRVAANIQKLAESLGLGIRVMDTEFQMDGNKLTVFFSSKVFVDFRKLQRSLFREFRCRIWLVNWAEVRPYTPVPVNNVC